jgi:hypothetical protein
MKSTPKLTAKLPNRLGKGGYILGPEFSGCFNTGKRPVLFKAFTGNKAFIVSEESEIGEARRKNLFGAYAGKRVLVCSGGKAFVTDSFKVAKVKFLELCSGIISFNKREAGKAKQLNVLIRAGKGMTPKALSLAMDLA